ncbi:hypothetical protein EON79_08125 [bacterium]|nr:MAG: hypothetical protein EON79_08125 [bacterium]
MIVPLLLPALLLQAGWTTLAPKDERFSVKMPSKPQPQKMSNTQAGYTVDTRMYRSMVKNGLTQVIVMHPVGKVDDTFRKAVITGFKGGFLRSSGGKELSQTTGKLGAYPATRVTFSLGNTRGEYWALQSKGDIYVVLAVAAPEKLEALKKPFFSSFKLK